jgi:hypothetical protein
MIVSCWVALEEITHRQARVEGIADLCSWPVATRDPQTIAGRFRGKADIDQLWSIDLNL